jgi:hypothetical protein
MLLSLFDTLLHLSISASKLYSIRSLQFSNPFLSNALLMRVQSRIHLLRHAPEQELDIALSLHKVC